MWKSWNANAVTISIPEVLTSLQTGVVNGFDNSTLFATAAGWHTTINHFVFTYHMYQPGIIIFNKKYWNKLSDNQKKIILGDQIGFGIKSRAAVRALEPELRAIMQSEGVTLYDISSQQRNIFKKQARRIHADITKNYIGQSLYNKASVALAAYRNKQ